jgi:capsid assembly protease
MQHNKILNAICGDTWLIDPDKLSAICEVLNVHLAGGSIDAETIKLVRDQAKENVCYTARPGPQAAANSGGIVGGTVGIITLYGTLSQRCGCFDSGAVSVERFGKLFDAAMADPSIASIVIDIDSPGGSVYGIQEIAEKIYKARGQKKIVAVANSLAASGAYWIAAAADELVITPGGDVGSVGVYCLHQDASEGYKQVGIKNTLISAGKYKVDGNHMEPLTDDARGYLQSGVNDIYNTFTKSLAKFRGVKVEFVRENFGQGRCVKAKNAVRQEMADGIKTLDEVVQALQKNKNKSFGSSGSAAEPETENFNIGVNEMSQKEIKAAVEADRAAENQRFADLRAEFDDAEFVADQFAAGNDVDQAKVAFYDMIKAQDETSQGPKLAATDEPVEPAETDEPVEPAETDEPVEPAETDEPVEPAETDEPVEPAATDEPVEPAKPAETKAKSTNGARPIANTVTEAAARYTGNNEFIAQAHENAKAQGITYREAAADLARENPDIHRKQMRRPQ